MKKIRVLHVFDCFRQGGIENFVMNVYRNIDRDKFQFDFAFVDRINGVFDNEVREMGGNIYYFDREEKSLSNYASSLKRIIKEYGPYDAVHSHIYFFSGIILCIARSCGVRIRIAHSHDTEKGKRKTLFRNSYELFMRSLIRLNATHMLACSELAGKYVFGAGANFTVLFNGIDVDRFTFSEPMRQDVRKQLNLTENKVLLNVGRFNEQKNHFFLIDFFARLVKQDPTFKLILVGTGNLLENVKKTIKEKHLEDHVIVLSNIKNIEVYYCASDCFVLPSKYEGMPIVSVEAQCNGLPVILSDRITKEVIITDIIKYLGIDGTENAWGEAVKNVVDRCVDRGKYSQIVRKSKFNVDFTVKQLEKIYASSRS